jgi:hypothetical protein
MARIDQGEGNELNLIGDGLATRSEEAHGVSGLRHQARVLG